jgi:hypothetical protein
MEKPYYEKLNYIVKWQQLCGYEAELRENGKSL